MKTGLVARWQANFLAGLAIILPAVISVGVLIWLFGTVARFTDMLLVFLPQELTHQNQGNGPMFWYWSLAALFLTIFLIGAVGLLARNYIGKRIISWVDAGMLRVPLLNKIYAATKQVNDAFSSGSKNSFRTVVCVEFPREGVYSLGFITSEQQEEIQTKTNQKVVCVFVPTTPNPTAGFLLLVPPEKVIKLDMSVADGIKYIISLGAIIPDYKVGAPGRPKDAEGHLAAVENS